MDYIQLETAIKKFEEMLEAYRSKGDRQPLEQEAIQDSLIKRFEYTLEVVWKTCKRHLEEEGFTEATTGSPKSIMRLALEAGLIIDLEGWLSYIDVRQNYSHDYSEDKAERALDIAEAFYDDVIGLYQAMTGKSW
ncbi:nucleotidyltransferase substrate binding protein [bacterium]|nr:nucleotidyltransferase substrate binding protein [bacterium]